jgi:hypothetical protein
MTLLEALRDPNLFEPFFRGPSWGPWKAFLAALFAELGPEADLATYRALTGRTAWPARAFHEAHLIVGRRGGKSRILALIATYLACFRSYAHLLAPGQRVRIAVLAKDREQAGEIFNYVLGLIEAAPLLAPMIMRCDNDSIDLNNRVTIAVTTASFRAVRGYTLAAALCDELAFWLSDDASANPDHEILRAVRPGLLNIPGSMLLVASSPYAKKGELYNVYRRSYGKDDGDVLVWKASTLEMNPAADRAFIAREYERDPESSLAEYGADFRDDLADFVTREMVDAVTMWGCFETPPQAGVTYAAFCDPSGGVRDSMALAIGHLGRDNVCVLDVLLEIRAPFNPDEAVPQCAELMRRYGVHAVIGDKYAREWPVARFRECGISFEQSARPKSDIYLDFLPLVKTGRVELLDYPRLSAQLCGLERRTARSGRDTVDHVRDAHDDLANAVAGCLVGLYLDRRPAMVDMHDLTGAKGEGVVAPWCEIGYAVIVDAGPDVASVFCLTSRFNPDVRTDQTLYIADVDVSHLRPGLFEGLARRVGGGLGSAIYAPKPLVAAIRASGFSARPFPDEFKPEEHLAFASTAIGKGGVKFCAATVGKMQTETIGAALALRAGDPVETALRAALIAAIWLKYASPQ